MSCCEHTQGVVCSEYRPCRAEARAHGRQTHSGDAPGPWPRPPSAGSPLRRRSDAGALEEKLARLRVGLTAAKRRKPEAVWCDFARRGADRTDGDRNTLVRGCSPTAGRPRWSLELGTASDSSAPLPGSRPDSPSCRRTSLIPRRCARRPGPRGSSSRAPTGLVQQRPRPPRPCFSTRTICTTGPSWTRTGCRMTSSRSRRALPAGRAWPAPRLNGASGRASRGPAASDRAQGQLQESLAAWRAMGKRGVWLKVPIAKAAFVGPAARFPAPGGPQSAPYVPAQPSPAAGILLFYSAPPAPCLAVCWRFLPRSHQPPDRAPRPARPAPAPPQQVAAGFIFHHAEPDYVMLTSWLPKTPSTLPPNASTQARKPFLPSPSLLRRPFLPHATPPLCPTASPPLP